MKQFIIALMIIIAAVAMTFLLQHYQAESKADNVKAKAAANKFDRQILFLRYSDSFALAYNSAKYYLKVQRADSIKYFLDEENRFNDSTTKYIK